MYSPSFSELAAVSIRRLAWAMNKNMGLAVDLMVLLLPASVKSDMVCAACKDKTKCSACIFKAGVTVPTINLGLLK